MTMCGKGCNMTNLNKSMGRIANDERFTPSILVEPILEFLKPESVVWCPFDLPQSEFVKILKANGHKVFYGHIAMGQDFFTQTPPPGCDYIISNPPFSKKLEVFKHLFRLNIPFAMLMNLEVLNYQVIGNFFYNTGEQLQLLIPDKKVSFDGNTSSFNSSYFCWKVLPRDLMFYHLPHNNTGKNFRGCEINA